MSDSNRVGIYISEDVETAFGEGVDPDSNADLVSHSLRYTGESLKGDTASTNSNEIRSDRNITSIIRTGLSASGDLNIEFHIPNTDGDTNNPQNDALRLLIADVLQTSDLTWNAAGTQYTCTSATSPDTFTDNGTAGTINTQYPVGSMVYATSATDPAINGWYIVTAVDTDELTVTPDIASVQSDVVVKGLSSTAGFLKNGTTARSRSVIKNYEDVSQTAGSVWNNVYGERYDGFMVDTMNLTIPTDGIITGSFGCMARRVLGLSNVDYLGTGATEDWGNNVVPQSTGEVINSIDHVVGCWINNVETNLTGLTLQIQNNLRSRLQVGTLGAISIGSGYVQVSGTLQAYFVDNDFLNKSAAWTTVPIHVVLTDAANHLFSIYVPKAKISSVQQVAGGVNQDVIVDMQWSGFVDSDLGGTIGFNSWELS